VAGVFDPAAALREVTDRLNAADEILERMPRHHAATRFGVEVVKAVSGLEALAAAGLEIRSREGGIGDAPARKFDASAGALGRQGRPPRATPAEEVGAPPAPASSAGAAGLGKSGGAVAPAGPSRDLSLALAYRLQAADDLADVAFEYIQAVEQAARVAGVESLPGTATEYMALRGARGVYKERARAHGRIIAREVAEEIEEPPSSPWFPYPLVEDPDLPPGTIEFRLGGTSHRFKIADGDEAEIAHPPVSRETPSDRPPICWVCGERMRREPQGGWSCGGPGGQRHEVVAVPDRESVVSPEYARRVAEEHAASQSSHRPLSDDERLSGGIIQKPLRVAAVRRPPCPECGEPMRPSEQMMGAGRAIWYCVAKHPLVWCDRVPPPIAEDWRCADCGAENDGAWADCLACGRARDATPFDAPVEAVSTQYVGVRDAVERNETRPATKEEALRDLDDALARLRPDSAIAREVEQHREEVGRHFWTEFLGDPQSMPAWTCRCGQRNTGWSRECGRCGTIRPVQDEPLCDKCWSRLQGDREPVRLTAHRRDPCVVCGSPTDGIVMRLTAIEIDRERERAAGSIGRCDEPPLPGSTSPPADPPEPGSAEQYRRWCEEAHTALAHAVKRMSGLKFNAQLANRHLARSLRRTEDLETALATAIDYITRNVKPKSPGVEHIERTLTATLNARPTIGLPEPWAETLPAAFGIWRRACLRAAREVAASLAEADEDDVSPGDMRALVDRLAPTATALVSLLELEHGCNDPDETLVDEAMTELDQRLREDP
jgi:hypothetical protein